MPDPRRARSLGMLDLILIVAAFAVWAAWTKSFEDRFRGNKDFSIWRSDEDGILFILKNQGGYLLLVASLTLLVIRLRGPRPPRRRLWRQPGLAASAGAVVGFLVGILGLLVEWSAPIPIPPRTTMIRSTDEILFERGEPFAGPGVAGAWLALFLTRRWRSERGAIDRLGQLVGVFWLLEFFMAEMPTTRCWIGIYNALVSWGTR